MTTEAQAIELVKRYAEVAKTRDLDELDAIFAPDFSNHSTGILDLADQRGQDCRAPVRDGSKCIVRLKEIDQRHKRFFSFARRR